MVPKQVLESITSFEVIVLWNIAFAGHYAIGCFIYLLFITDILAFELDALSFIRLICYSLT